MASSKSKKPAPISEPGNAQPPAPDQRYRAQRRFWVLFSVSAIAWAVEFISMMTYSNDIAEGFHGMYAFAEMTAPLPIASYSVYSFCSIQAAVSCSIMQYGMVTRWGFYFLMIIYLLEPIIW